MPLEVDNADVWVKRSSSNTSSEFGNLGQDSSSAALISDTKKKSDLIFTDVEQDKREATEGIIKIPKWKRYTGVAILFFINLLNYMDRFTIAGVLIEITHHFQISMAMAGLLQTVFIISYMLVAPLFGYLGDRYNRIYIIIAGMILWSGFTLGASFIQKPEHFTIFLMMRGLVGIGEASYSTIAPTLIGDMFVGPQRTRMLSVFFFAIPVGSGLGYIVGSAVAKQLGGWEWALRVTPGLGVIAIFLLLFLHPNPPRGASETTKVVDDKNRHSYKEDLSYLLKNKSFICVTIGFTFMAFVVGSLTLWGPTYFAYSQIAIGKLAACSGDDCSFAEISFIFGLITCVAGFGGVGIGAESARRWKLKGCHYADALVCAIGLLVGAPLLCVGVHLAIIQVNVAWTFIFFADLFLCLTWTLIGDMTLYVTQPSRRSTANAVQLLIGHLFGDAGSPYLLGLIADSLMEGGPDTYVTKYLALQRAMYVTLFACVIGGGGFLMASLYVVEDRKKVDDFLKGTASPSSTQSSSIEKSEVSLNKMKKRTTVNGTKPHLLNDTDNSNQNAIDSKNPQLYLDDENEDVEKLLGQCSSC